MIPSRLIAQISHLRSVLILSIALIILIFGSIVIGAQLKVDAEYVWQGQAQDEAESISNKSLSGLNVFQSNLRNLSTLFHVSDHITPDIFLDAVSLMEETDVASPISTWVMAKVQWQDKTHTNFNLPIHASTENTGPLATGSGLERTTEYYNAAKNALMEPGKVITAQSASHVGETHIHVLFAINVPYNGGDGILFSTIDINSFLKDLHTLYASDGLILNSVELLTESHLNEAHSLNILRPQETSPLALHSFTIKSQCGEEIWRFKWSIADNYRNGPATALGRIIQFGGGILGGVMLIAFIHLSRENIRVTSLVQKRTAELNRALVSAELANKHLSRISRMDSLTQIPNRRAFDEFMSKEWARAQRERIPFAIIIIDIDFFKAYNDSLGHQAGDTCLNQIASILKKTVKRPRDLVARYGGEEFVCALPGTDILGVQTLCERLRSAINDANIPHPDSTIAKHISVSLGASCMIASKKLSASQIIHEADTKLYEAKNAGRNCYKISTAIDTTDVSNNPECRP